MQVNRFGVIELLALEDEDVPAELTAVIVKVYAVFNAYEPVTVKGEVVPLVERAMDGEDVTVQEEIGSLLEGAVKVSDTVVELVTVAVPTVGAVGAPFVPED